MATKESCRRVEEENGCLTDGRLSLLVELGTTKDDFTAIRERSFAERLALEAKFDASNDVIFNYGYGCCAFAHDIRGSKPKILDGMLDTSTPLTLKFFVNPRCPPGSSFVLSTVEPVKIAEEALADKASRVLREGLIYYGSPLLGQVRLLRVRIKCILPKCIFHDNLLSAFVFRRFIFCFLDIKYFFRLSRVI